MKFSKIKYFHSILDGTQPFDITSGSSQHLQHDDGNLRYQITNSELIKSRPINGRLNSNRFIDSQISNLNDHRDFLSERRVYHDRAAAKIQAAYRGYSVRKSLPWLNDKQKVLHDEFNQRVKPVLFYRIHFSFFLLFSLFTIETMLQLISIYV
jgi:hypothetical protein